MKLLTCLSAAAAMGAFALALRAEEKTVIWTGWFSDLQCATATTAGGKFGPTNPDCAETCIRKGASPAFISETAKAVYKVKDYPGVLDDLGYRVEVEATVDEAAKTMIIRKVTRGDYQGPACARPKKPVRQ